MKMGRPTKYKEEYCQEIIDFMKQGYSKEAFAGHIGISKQQIYRWRVKHKEFRTAIKRAETACQEFWEELGIQLVLAGQGNATAWIFNMKNRFRKNGWNDETKQNINFKGLNNLIQVNESHKSVGVADESKKG